MIGVRARVLGVVHPALPNERGLHPAYEKLFYAKYAPNHVQPAIILQIIPKNTLKKMKYFWKNNLFSFDEV
jgi:hypothetical protein